jgi:hypothetical protein
MKRRNSDRAERREIHHAAKFLAGDQQIDRAHEVSFMNPGNELRSRPLSAAKTITDESQEHIDGRRAESIALADFLAEASLKRAATQRERRHASLHQSP